LKTKKYEIESLDYFKCTKDARKHKIIQKKKHLAETKYASKKEDICGINNSTFRIIFHPYKNMHDYTNDKLKEIAA